MDIYFRLCVEELSYGMTHPTGKPQVERCYSWQLLCRGQYEQLKLVILIYDFFSVFFPFVLFFLG